MPIRPLPVAALLMLLTLPLLGEEPPAPAPALTQGELVRVSVGDDLTMTFTAPAAGLLTIAVHSVQDSVDLAFEVTDLFGQVEGYRDADFNGRAGSEHGMVRLTEAGTYLVRIVQVNGSDAVEADLVAQFVAVPFLELPRDVDGTPDQAVELAPSQQVKHQIDQRSNDYRDWFVIPIKQAGSLTVFLKGSGDLRLETFAMEQYTEPVASSDQDLNGDAGNEVLVADVAAGDVVYVRVTSPVEQGEPIDYTLGTALIPAAE